MIPNKLIPWKVVGREVVREDNNHFIASIEGECPSDTSDATLPLIAAAPDMLEALEGLLAVSNTFPQPPTHDGLTLVDLLADARRAVNKARSGE